MAGQQLAADGGLSDITSLLNLVKDQKSSSSTSTNISTAGVQQEINDILQSNNGLAAVAGAQKSAGLYNSSTNTQLTNDLLARAAAQVASKNATTTTSNVKKASVTKSNVESLLASVALKKAIGGKGIVQNSKDLYKSIADELGIGPNSNAATDSALQSVQGAGPGAQVGDFTSLEDSLANGTDINAVADAVTGGATTQAADTSVAGLEQLDSDAAAAGGASVGGATAAQSAAFSAGTADGLAGAEADFGIAGAGADTAAAAGGADLGIGADALSGATAAGGWTALALYGGLDAAGDIKQGNKDVLATDVVGGLGTGDILQGINAYKSNGDVENAIATAAGPAAPFINNVEDKITGGWIVCTELLRQGRFNKKHYAAGLRVFESYPKHLLAGYYVWATPLVSYIRRKPDSIIASVAQHVFSARAEFLAARAGVSGARDTAYGQSISAVMFGICWLLGQFLYRKEIRSWKKALGGFYGY